jgi:GNAT superfamily N-acetyltransferase
VFELSDSLIDDIAFAMEDQAKGSLVDISTGAVLPRGPQTEGDGFAEPPVWSSREGYQLMEAFLMTVRSPSARQELSSSLCRGRGVFKAFKEALAAFPEIERAYHEYKAAAMRRVIRNWYDELREDQGLARLGPEPEDSGDLVESDLGIELGEGGPQREAFIRLADGLEAELLECLPEALVVDEAEALVARLEGDTWLGAWIGDGEGGIIAGAAASLKSKGGRSYARLFFLGVLLDFRRTGMGKALVQSLVDELSRRGIGYIVLDLPFIPAEFGAALESAGLKPYGVRGYLRN